MMLVFMRELEWPGEEKKKRCEAKAVAISAGSGSGSGSEKVVEKKVEVKEW
ncbi:hypothetical protein Fmac_027916 [Flemingia macrophylla]|uniref:Uncharacterized protein n=1 Tax=Flemingia macrophylla TaxID=520843 RepID=A0ABD1LJ67_9FABA